MFNRDLRVGIVSHKDLNSIKSISSRMLCENLLKIAEKRFRPDYFFVDKCNCFEKKEKEFKKFISSCDIILELPVQEIFGIKDSIAPIVFFALGYMTNPFGFFAKFHRRLLANNSILFSSKADLEIFQNSFDKNFSSTGYYFPFPLNTNEFKPQVFLEKTRIRTKFNIPLDNSLILYSGRINEQKNIHILIRMFSELVRIIPKLILCIAGEEDNNPYSEISIATNKGYLAYLKRKCAQYSISDKVIFTGHLKKNDLIALYSSAQVLLNLTTHYGENFGYAQVEAMACGTPVICTDWGGLKDTVIPGKTGYRIPTKISQNSIRVEWQKSLDVLIELLMNKERLINMSKNCVKHVKESFSFDKISNLLEAIFLGTLKRKSQNKPINNLSQDVAKNKNFMNSFLEHLYRNSKDKNYFRQKLILAPYSSTSLLND